MVAIYVTWGDRVNAGEPPFKIDDRDLQGQLPVAIAKVKESEATLAKTRNLLKIAEGVDPQAWLADVLNRIADHPISGLAALLPWCWKTSREIMLHIRRCRLIRGPRRMVTPQRAYLGHLGLLS